MYGTPERISPPVLLQWKANDIQSRSRAEYSRAGIRNCKSRLLPDEGYRSLRDNERCSRRRRENFTSPETTVNFLAEQLQLNRCYLSRLFHGKTGVTLSEYILRKRLEYAKELLIHSDHTVFNIASLCGFSDSSYFMRFFYKQTGMTPSQFRRSFLQEHKKRKAEKNNNSGLPSIISNE